MCFSSYFALVSLASPPVRGRGLRHYSLGAAAGLEGAALQGDPLSMNE